MASTTLPTAGGAAPDAGGAGPLVTVIVPVWNGERYLRESLDSILAQTYPNIEVIVLDDASTDGTPAIIASYGERVRAVRQPQNRGIYANANAGIAMARGEYIAIYHADDIYEPAIVEREVAYLRAHPEAGAVFCMDIFVDADGREYDRLALPREVRGGSPLDLPTVLGALLTHMNSFLRCPGAMVRAATYRAVGTYRPEMFRNMADVDMWLRIAQQYPIGLLEEHLYRYRHFHGNDHQRFHHLRTAPDRFFEIIDHHLPRLAGERAAVTPAALSAYEAHRAEDTLMCAVSRYILGQRTELRATLGAVSLRRLTGSGQVQRWRLAALFVLLRLLSLLPPIPPVARAFYRRWHEKRPPTPRQAPARVLG